MECETLVHDAAKEWTEDSNEVLSFKMVRCNEDMLNEEEDDFFGPEMTHQVYGQNEEIFGYKNLSIQLYATAAKLRFYCHTQHDGKIKAKSGEPAADELVTPLAELLPANSIMDNREAFLATLKDDEKFTPFGEQLHRFSKTLEGKERTFEVYKCSVDDVGFSDYFERLQMFVMFFVDAASLIDLEDPAWDYFVAYEVYKTACGSTQYAVAGYSCVYQFYAYPDMRRPRVSQMLVLPPFQRLGVGSALLQAVYGAYSGDAVKSITVEGPSDVFSHMKLLLDCRNCMQLPAFQPKQLLGGVTKLHYDTALKKLKLGKEPIQRIANALLLNFAKFSSEPQHYKAFKAALMWQLAAVFRRQDKDRARVVKHGLSKDEVNEAVTLVPEDKRQELLEQTFREEEEKLMRVVEHLPRVSLEA